ncbi:hypothetical protein IQ260_19650 [Leptolyngbya cf. ectocarpi LEGE 11479]|uniref:Uncharacterized protein n=1 Tax=Leptolyngbya cf. ectocarpi LEGE 11479 TaxID=1828722 RepID=A0A928ZWR1_LEPEC|nr:hypothetical protein [Leptolyngbya ectocarpi]MBE9068863.1 hypothetical protein [Leptolyngbya cf. ectocarpi LEGE 11479]
MKTTIADGVIEIKISYQESVEKGWLSRGGVILPGHPLFSETLNTPSADIVDDLRFGESSNQRHLVFGADGLMRTATESQLDCYIQDGEYEQRLERIGSLNNG